MMTFLKEQFFLEQRDSSTISYSFYFFQLNFAPKRQTFKLEDMSLIGLGWNYQNEIICCF